MEPGRTLIEPVRTPQCAVCTRRNGHHIIAGTDEVVQTVNVSDALAGSLCPRSFQCVGWPNDATGCCQRCAPSQSCAEGTIANESTFNLDNLCPDGYICRPEPSLCKTGTICHQNRLLDCVELQTRAKQEGLGDIHAGAYCPAGHSMMSVCPTGFFCPDAATKLICPQGHFCPMKTATPHIRCHSCPAGSLKLVRNELIPIYAACALLLVSVSSVLLRCHRGWRRTGESSGKEKLPLRHAGGAVSPRDKNGCSPRFGDYFGLSYHNLTVTVPVPSGAVKVLSSVSGRLRDKSLVALMGESGSGKTSLINAISGRAQYAEVSGTISLNGRAACIEKCRRLVGVVPQDDVIHTALTVMENLVFAGRFALPSRTSHEELHDLAYKVMLSLGLLSVKDRIVGSSESTPRISGGERRRCSIGIELMARPKVLFCDEPTSGLDSASSMLVMSHLKSLVAKGSISTIVTAIHQPRQKIFNLFDDLILLSKGGRQLYMGSAKKAVAFFVNQGFTPCENENPGDFLLDITTNAKDGTGLITSVSPKSCMSCPPVSIELPQMPSTIDQIWTQLCRNMLLSYRGRREKAVDACMVIGGALLISALEGVVELTQEPSYDLHFSFFEANTTALPFFSIWRHAFGATTLQQQYGLKIAICCGVLSGLSETRIHSERRATFFRETASGYSIDAYFLGLQVQSIMEHGLVMFMAGLCSFWMRHPISSPLSYVVNFLLLGYSMGAFGALFSVVVKPENLLLSSGLFLLSFNLLAAGVVEPILYKDIYDNWVLGLISSLFSPARFFIETMVVSDHKNLAPQSGFTLQSSSVPFSSFDFINEAQLDPERTVQSDRGWYWGSTRLFVVGTFWRCLSLVLIHVSARDKQCKKPLMLHFITEAGAIIHAALIVLVLASMLCAIGWFVRH